MYRINQPQLVPSLGYSNDEMIPPAKWQLGDMGVSAPHPVKKLVDAVNWDWLHDVSSRIARQYRKLNVGLGQWLRESEGKPIMMDDSTPLPAIAGAHAWLMALAQQAGMDVRDAELEVTGEEGVQRGVMELAGVAMLAGAENPRGTGSRLTAVLKALAADLVVRCAGLPAGQQEGAMIQFVHRKSLQLKSPVDERRALPMAAYVIRFSGYEPSVVMRALKESLAAVSEALGDEMRESVLVLNPAIR